MAVIKLSEVKFELENIKKIYITSNNVKNELIYISLNILSLTISVKMNLSNHFSSLMFKSLIIYMILSIL